MEEQIRPFAVLKDDLALVKPFQAGLSGTTCGVHLQRDYEQAEYTSMTLVISWATQEPVLRRSMLEPHSLS